MLAELDDVILLRDHEAEDDEDRAGILPEGSRGTIVSVLGGGAGFTIEFETPFHALLEVRADDVRGMPGATREHLAASVPR